MPDTAAVSPDPLDETTCKRTDWGRLKRRPEFQRAGKGRRVGGRAVLLQANARAAEDASVCPRFGLTVTKKTGDSPARNRIRRRLRAAMREISPQAARPDHDYVLVGKRDALFVRFDALVEEIAGAIRRSGADKRDASVRDGKR